MHILEKNQKNHLSHEKFSEMYKAASFYLAETEKLILKNLFSRGT